MTTATVPIRLFSPEDPAPCLRLQLHDQSQIVLPYYLLGETTLDASGQLLICHFGNTVIQIEGRHLQDLLIGLQYHRIESIQNGGFAKDQPNPLTINRIALVQLRDIA